MQMTFSVRHGEVPERLRDHAEREVEGLAKYFDRLVEADIILDHEGGHRHVAEVRIRTSNDTHFAATEAGDWRTAIDETVDKLRRQLKRHKGKLEQRGLTREERQQVFAREAAESTAAGPTVSSGWDRLSRDEAVARLEGSGEEVLVFVDVEDEAVKIARRSEAGSVSVVEADVFEIEEP